MEFLPVVDNIQMKGTVSQILDIGLSLYFMIKKTEVFVIVFLTLYNFNLAYIQIYIARSALRAQVSAARVLEHGDELTQVLMG